MKKEILLPAAAWLGGVAGFGLRRWELAAAYNPDTKLMHTGCPATWLLLGMSCALVLLFLFLCRPMGKRPAQQWFYAPVDGIVVLIVSGSLILVMAGILGLWEQSVAHRADAVRMFTWLVCIVGGVAGLMAGRVSRRGQEWDKLPLLLMGPAFAVLAWLVAVYQTHSRQPVVQLYMWQIVSAAAVVLAMYGLVSLSLDKGSAGRTCVYALLGIALSLVALADGSGMSFRLVWIFACVYLTAYSYTLLRSAFGRPWPEQMPEETEQRESEPMEE